jgi:hypothetical protein
MELLKREDEKLAADEVGLVESTREAAERAHGSP